MKIKKGFTLIELLVVIAIIGILSTVVLVNLSGTRQRARDARRKSDLANIRLAIEMYYDAQSTPAYPADAGWSDAIKAYMSGGVTPTDPKGGTAYCYKKVSVIEYQICAKLESVSDDSSTTTKNESVLCLPNESYAGCDTLL